MSEPKNFLARWSERKRNPEAETPPPDGKEPVPPVAAEGADAPPAPEPEFDISTLPSLDSITANSDVRAFLQRGVPAELTRAALRRAWSADPAIRDFVGLSENSWDFNAPDSIPGFASSLPAEELKRTAAQLLDDVAKEAERRSPPESRGESAQIPAENEERGKSDSNADFSSAEKQGSDVAAQHEQTAASINSSRQPRRHGGALPE